MTSFFSKVAGFGLVVGLFQVFSCEFYETFENNLFTEHLWVTNFVEKDYNSDVFRVSLCNF